MHGVQRRLANGRPTHGRNEVESGATKAICECTSGGHALDGSPARATSVDSEHGAGPNTCQFVTNFATVARVQVPARRATPKPAA